MSLDAPIHSWPGSYYLTSNKRWENGTLSLSRRAVRFVSNQTKETLASFRLSRVTEMKMESSSLIFSTLTVLEEGNVKHWFGSLKPNRVVVYNVMEHFWRERLLSPTGSEGRSGVPGSEPSKGRELINLVAGAQRRLEDTGRVLSYQGEQFDSMMQGLEKMDSDLGVADKLLSELESPSWWPFSKLPWKIQQEAKAEDAARAAATASKESGRSKVIASIPAVVSKDSDCNLKPGCLLVLPSSLEVRDATCHLLHRFERGEVDEIRVHSPYEITVRQRFIGRPDVRCRLLSAKMPEALAVLEMQYKKKVEFAVEYAAFRATPVSSPCDAEAANLNDGLLHGWHEMEVPAGELSQLQVHVLQPAMSQAETQELKQMLLQLKSLALEAETELERQDEALTVLANSADQASMTIGKHTCRMKKLL